MLRSSFKVNQNRSLSCLLSRNPINAGPQIFQRIRTALGIPQAGSIFVFTHDVFEIDKDMRGGNRIILATSFCRGWFGTTSHTISNKSAANASSHKSTGARNCFSPKKNEISRDVQCFDKEVQNVDGWWYVFQVLHTPYYFFWCVFLPRRDENSYLLTCGRMQLFRTTRWLCTSHHVRKHTLLCVWRCRSGPFRAILGRFGVIWRENVFYKLIACVRC